METSFTITAFRGSGTGAAASSEEGDAMRLMGRKAVRELTTSTKHKPGSQLSSEVAIVEIGWLLRLLRPAGSSATGLHSDFVIDRERPVGSRMQEWMWWAEAKLS